MVYVYRTTKFRKMGKVMSALGRRATKPIRDFNVESRAHREITKEKRPVAPRHESTRLIIEESIRSKRPIILIFKFSLSLLFIILFIFLFISQFHLVLPRHKNSKLGHCGHWPDGLPVIISIFLHLEKISWIKSFVLECLY